MELINKAALVREIDKRIALLENNSDGIISMLASGMFVNEYKDLLSFIDTLELKEVEKQGNGNMSGINIGGTAMTREELIEQKAKELGQKYFPNECNVWARPNYEAQYVEFACKEMVEWADKHPPKLWVDAQGDDLPEIDRDVIVLCDDGHGGYKVCFGHRPYKKGYLGKSLVTGNIETFYPQTYGKGGWNVPDVKWWLDCVLPNLEEEK